MESVVTLEDSLSTWHIRICKRWYNDIFFFLRVEGEEKVVEIFYMKNESGRWIERLEFFSLWKKNMTEFFREHGINLVAYIWKEEILH